MFVVGLDGRWYVLMICRVMCRGVVGVYKVVGMVRLVSRFSVSSGMEWWWIIYVDNREGDGVIGVVVLCLRECYWFRM